MSSPEKHRLSRCDFIKGTTAAIGGLIGALIGIPSVAYLLSPATQAGAESEAVKRPTRLVGICPNVNCAACLVISAPGTTDDHQPVRSAFV